MYAPSPARHSCGESAHMRGVVYVNGGYGSLM